MNKGFCLLSSYYYECFPSYSFHLVLFKMIAFRKNVVKQNNFYDLDLSLEYEDFTYADRHLFFIADYFVFQQRTYSFQLYDELFWENSGKFSFLLRSVWKLPHLN